ncbi:hypothetical protein K461DRAFT_280375 [Myriangium duriaei CBS 260.36]|uniref:RRM domain-containing protein n=1 Tax=Myriangium duriaei CBS 260.36 TaxID=1168546 RepID=A0A9P4IUT0_9PEZI|nr:hypothetical protein K461DRAFT_280375 [Myriangium duriaei CBS 260.36]
MADEDDFDIDIYGDDKPEFVAEPADEPKANTTKPVAQHDPDPQRPQAEPETEPSLESAVGQSGDPDPGDTISQQESTNVTMKDAPPTADSVGLASDAPQQRHSGEDSRPVAPGATSALKLSELQWYTTEDEIRGWANQAKAEDELNEITFSEHKINGKSKGEAFVDLQSPQAATAMKWHLDQMIKDQPAAKKMTVTFAPPEHNPYKTHAKDASTRNRDNTKDRPVNSYNHQSYNNTAQTGFRGGRGNYNRGAFHNQSRGGFNNTHNNGQLGMGGGFGGMNNMGGMGMGNFNNMSFNRGSFHGNRGGRGGMMGGNMGMMPNMGMGGMGGMGGMNMGMGMDMGMGGMGNMGFGGFPQGQFNQQQQQHFGGNAQSNMSNPHGAKRQRPE